MRSRNSLGFRWPPWAANREWRRRGCAGKSATPVAMKADRWELLEQLFESAVKLAPAARAEFVKRRCGSDRGLQREVASLLTWYSGAGLSSKPRFAVRWSRWRKRSRERMSSA